MSEEGFSGEFPQSELSPGQENNEALMNGLLDKYPNVFFRLHNTEEESSTNFIFFKANNAFPNSFRLKDWDFKNGVVAFSRYGVLTIENDRFGGDYKDYLIEMDLIKHVINKYDEGETRTGGTVEQMTLYKNRPRIFHYDLYQHGFDSHNLPSHLNHTFLGKIFRHTNDNLNYRERPERTPADVILSEMA
jgi:hypothetical protein